MMEDPVPVITRKHFEEGFKYARMSVNEADLAKYKDFAQKFEPQGSNRTDNSNFGWPDHKQQSNPRDDHIDDLYS